MDSENCRVKSNAAPLEKLPLGNPSDVTVGALVSTLNRSALLALPATSSALS